MFISFRDIAYTEHLAQGLFCGDYIAKDYHLVNNVLGLQFCDPFIGVVRNSMFFLKRGLFPKPSLVALAAIATMSGATFTAQVRFCK